MFSMWPGFFRGQCIGDALPGQECEDYRCVLLCTSLHHVVFSSLSIAAILTCAQYVLTASAATEASARPGDLAAEHCPPVLTYHRTLHAGVDESTEDLLSVCGS